MDTPVSPLFFCQISHKTAFVFSVNIYSGIDDRFHNYYILALPNAYVIVDASFEILKSL